VLRRSFVLVVAACATVLITAAPSHAAPAQADDYTAVCSVSVSPTNPFAGDTVTLTGEGFPTSPSSVEISIDGPEHVIGIAHIDGSGQFSESVTIPADLSTGEHLIGVVCEDFFGITVVDVRARSTSSTPSSPSGGSAPLARTGTNTTQPLVVAGLGAIAAGSALVLTARRRRLATVHS
jgi:LPXTG-motif cell wall-anchored protein